MAHFLEAAEAGDATAQFQLGQSFREGTGGIVRNAMEAFEWFSKSAEQGHDMGQFSVGICYIYGWGVEKNLGEAVKWFRRAAEQGNSEAQNSLGNCCANGWGVSKDFNEAFRWYLASAKQGNADGLFSLGRCHQLGNGVAQDSTEAVMLFRQAAEQGNANAQHALGTCFQTGTGVIQDFSEAIKWYRKAAESNNSKAIDSLKALAMKNNNSDAFNVLLVLANLHEIAAWRTIVGDCYRNGWGIAKDLNEAVTWYRRAAELGDSDGMYNLGQCHANGCGVAKDQAEAVKWYRKAADLGNAKAACSLALCYEFGRGVEEDRVAATKWYTQAAKKRNHYALAHSFENGVTHFADLKKAFELYRRAFEENEQASDASFNMGSFHENGKGVDQNLTEAVSWYRKSAELGNALAQNNLARCYQNGIGVEKDLCEAFNWYRMSAEQGDATGQHILGRCYEEGLGVATDLTEAVKWYRISTEQGSFDALINLARCYRDGLGVERDLATAIDTLRFANSKNRPLALLKLGNWYRHGDGVAKDPEEAVKWYRQSAEQGNHKAKVTLGCWYERGQRISLDYKEAKRLYEEAADAGDSLGKCRLGALYEHGRGVEKNEIVAAEWHFKAAQAGEHYSKGFVLQYGIDVNQNLPEAVRCYQIALQEDDMNYDAHYRLAFCYDHGLGVSQDFELAKEAYEKAAALGHAAAHRQLAILHENGQGVPSRNPEEARRLYCRAADLGDEESKLRLAGLVADANEMVSSQVTFISRYSSDHTRAISSIALCPDHLHLACASHLFPSISFIDVSTGKALWKLPHAAHQVVFSPDGNHLAAACLDHTVRIIDVITGIVERQLIGHTDVVHGVAWSSEDPSLIASASRDKTARVWRVDGTLLHTLSDHESGVNGICFSAYNGVHTVSGDHSIRIWDVYSGKLIKNLEEDSNQSYFTTRCFADNHCTKQRIAFSAGGNSFAVSSCFGVIWFNNSGYYPVEPKQQKRVSYNVDLAWSPKGRFVASADGANLRIFNDLDQKECFSMPCMATSVVFSFSGDEIIVGSSDGSISRWESNLGTAMLPSNPTTSIPLGKIGSLPTELTDEVEEALDRIGVIIQRLEHPTAFQKQVQQLHRLNDPALRIKMPQIDLCRKLQLQHDHIRKVKGKWDKTIKFTHELHNKDNDNIQVSICGDAKAAQEESIATVHSLSKVLDQEISLIRSNLAEYSIISMQSASATNEAESKTFPRPPMANELARIVDSSDLNAKRLKQSKDQLLKTAESFTKALIDYDNCCAQFREESEKNVEALSGFIEYLANPRIEESKIKEMEEIIESVRDELNDYNRISGALTDILGELAKEASIGSESTARASKFVELCSISDGKGKVEIKMQIDETCAAPVTLHPHPAVSSTSTQIPSHNGGGRETKRRMDATSAAAAIASEASHIEESSTPIKPASFQMAAARETSRHSPSPVHKSAKNSSAMRTSKGLSPFSFSSSSSPSSSSSKVFSPSSSPSPSPSPSSSSSASSFKIVFNSGASETLFQSSKSLFKFGAASTESPEKTTSAQLISTSPFKFGAAPTESPEKRNA